MLNVLHVAGVRHLSTVVQGVFWSLKSRLAQDHTVAFEL